MTDLQAAIDFTVELGSFYNIDLFQRGYYQIRVGMKSFSNRTPYKVEVSLPKNKDCDLVFPACIINGVAVSKTFQIMYKNEDVLLNDLVSFKLQMLVDSSKLEDCIEKSGLQLIIELWFNEEESGAEQHDKFECVCARALNLNFQPSKGLHTHTSVLFDYFYLSAIGVTVHGSLVALHQPIYNPRQPNSSWPLRGNTLSTLESVLFNARLPSAAAHAYKHINGVTLQSASYMFHHISQVLLSAYESLQSTFEKFSRVAASSKTLKPLVHKDCYTLLADMSKEIEMCDSEEEFLQHATSKIAHLCAYNVVLWDKFVEVFASNVRAAKHMAREHHLLKVKRYAEGFFTLDFPKSALSDCYEPSLHGHVELAARVRSSAYFQSLPSLPLECIELDGDAATLPIVFEDVFTDSMERAISITDLSIRSDDTSTSSADLASTVGELADALPTAPRTRSRNVIRNVLPHTLRRPSSYALDDAAQGKRWEAKEHRARKEQPQLIGYKKLSSDFDRPASQPQSVPYHGSAHPFLGDPLSPARRSLLMPSRAAPSSAAAALVSDAAAAGARTTPLKRRGSSRRLERTQRNSGSLPDLSPNKFAEEESEDEDAQVEGVFASHQGFKRVSSFGMASSCSDSGCGPSVSGSDRGRAVNRAKCFTFDVPATEVVSTDESANDGRCSDGHMKQTHAADTLSGAAENGTEARDTPDALARAALYSENSAVAGKKDCPATASATGGNLCNGKSGVVATPQVHTSISDHDLPSISSGSKPTAGTGMAQSKSEPGFSQQQRSRSSAESLVQPVADAMLSFLTAKEELKAQMNYSGHLYSDFASLPSSAPYFWLPGRREKEDMHLIIGVHGLDGNNQDLRLVRTYLEIAMPGDRVDFLMSECNKDTFVDFETMSEKLVNEILHHLDMYSTMPTRISFIGHSLGNIIIRSALCHQKLEHILPNLHTYLSLSGPHLGTLYGQSGLVNMGMWVIQKLKKSSSLLQLSLRDKLELNETFLYKLSKQPGLEFFKNILLVSSPQDKYVPYHSTRIEVCRAAVRDSSDFGRAYIDMVQNLLAPLIRRPNLTVVRYDVYHALSGGANSMIGRAAHIAVLDSELFLEKFITVSALKYFK